MRRIQAAALPLFVISMSMLIGLIACGGGGGDGSGNDTPQPVFTGISVNAGLEPKTLEFAWEVDLPDSVDHYRLEVDPAGTLEFSTEDSASVINETEYTLVVPVHLTDWAHAQFRVVASDADDNALSTSDGIALSENVESESIIGYIKASNTNGEDYFGRTIALSADGRTMAVGAIWEDSGATGIDGEQNDNSADKSGAVYVFVQDEAGGWSQQAYIKASNTNTEDYFGSSIALSDDGRTMAVGAIWEESAATGIGGDQSDNSADKSGAVYVFVQDDAGVWSQEAYFKASNTNTEDYFGSSIALSDDGRTMAVGAIWEASIATGIGGDQTDNSASGAGAVYVFVRNGAGVWSQQAYVKASNTEAVNGFGGSITLSADGRTMAVGAIWEDSGTTGVGGDQADNSASEAGAVYVFVQDDAGTWSQQAYIKASNTGTGDHFGSSIALSDDGRTMVVGAVNEASAAAGIGGEQNDDSALEAGAVYVFAQDDAGAWSQQAYIKASNTGAGDHFGSSIALSDDGLTMVVGAVNEASAATGVGGNQDDNSASGAGAVYGFVRNSDDVWSQQAYTKASNTGTGDHFAYSIALSADGLTMAAGAVNEASAATGVGGDQNDNSMVDAGVVYLY